MKAIAIISQKGGAGKNTCAINLSVAATLKGKRSAIIDLDPQASSTSWSDARQQESPVVLNCIQPRGSLANEAQEAIESYGVQLSPVRISQRAAFIHSITSNQSVQEFEPKGKASEEVEELFKWIVEQTNK